MYDLSGKVAIVTGAGGRNGIGRAIANRLTQEGADVVEFAILVVARHTVALPLELHQPGGNAPSSTLAIAWPEL